MQPCWRKFISRGGLWEFIALHHFLFPLSASPVYLKCDQLTSFSDCLAASSLAITDSPFGAEARINCFFHKLILVMMFIITTEK